MLEKIKEYFQNDSEINQLAKRITGEENISTEDIKILESLSEGDLEKLIKKIEENIQINQNKGESKEQDVKILSKLSRKVLLRIEKLVINKIREYEFEKGMLKNFHNDPISIKDAEELGIKIKNLKAMLNSSLGERRIKISKREKRYQNARDDLAEILIAKKKKGFTSKIINLMKFFGYDIEKTARIDYLLEKFFYGENFFSKKRREQKENGESFPPMENINIEASSEGDVPIKNEREENNNDLKKKYDEFIASLNEDSKKFISKGIYYLIDIIFSRMRLNAQTRIFKESLDQKNLEKFTSIGMNLLTQEIIPNGEPIDAQVYNEFINLLQKDDLKNLAESINFQIRDRDRRKTSFELEEEEEGEPLYTAQKGILEKKIANMEEELEKISKISN